MSQEIIFGIHTIVATLNMNPHRVIELYLLKGREDHRLQELLNIAQQHQISIQFVSTRKQLDDLAMSTQHQGVVARCRKGSNLQEHDLESLLNGLSIPPFLLILDGVQDPHNLGSCLRTADAAGVQMIIAPIDGSVGLTPVVHKVASGAAEVVPFIQVTNLARTLKFLKDRGIWVFGASSESAISLYEADLKGPLALVLGAEGKGLRRLTRDLCDQLISIPMHGTVASLNVSVATGICLYEAVRQRNNGVPGRI